ncbi:hypothetical protein ACNIUU_26370, partial [Escherichia coli]
LLVLNLRPVLSLCPCTLQNNQHIPPSKLPAYLRCYPYNSDDAANDEMIFYVSVLRPQKKKKANTSPMLRVMIF